MIWVIGAGGHCKVVLDALLASGTAPTAICVRDARPWPDGAQMFGVVVRWPDIDDSIAGGEVHVAIGAAADRARVYAAAAGMGATALTVIHPSAIISPRSSVAAGSFIAALAVVGPQASLGQGVIVNHAAVVDHDCSIGAYSHVAPNATLGGRVTVGEHVLIGAGAVVLPGLRIEDHAIIGAGAVVTRDVASGQIWTGVPAGPRTRDQ